MIIQIKKISAEDTLSIRHSELWPEKPLDFVKIEGDENGIHLGLFLEDKLVTVISLFGADKSLRFRKFATIEQYRNQGLGSKMMHFVIKYAEENGYERIWCDARANALRFYDQFGFRKFSVPFYKGNIPYAKIEKWLSK